MSANVRCTNPRMVPLTEGGALPFCGWKGERKTRIYAPITFTFHRGGRHVEDRWLAVDPTVKPCPRCGGKVVLIEGDQP